MLLNFIKNNISIFSKSEDLIFNTQEYNQYYQNHIDYYLQSGLSISKSINLIKKNFKKYSENIFFKSKYEKLLNEKFIENNLIDEKSKYVIGSFINYNNEIEISLFSAEDCNISLKDRTFLPNEFKEGKKIIFKENKITIFPLSYKNDLMLDLEDIQTFFCNGEKSNFISIDEMIDFCNFEKIKIKYIWVGNLY
jgi:hypothetical protein